MADATTPKYRVGMIGCGMQGRVHARSYFHNPYTEVVAVADTDPENVRSLSEALGVPGYADYDDMLRNERLDIAAPVLPVRANVDAIVGSARGGVKAIFCEKPLTASLEDAARAVEECRSRGVYFYGGHTFRNYPQMWKAREIIESGELGEVQSINLYDGNGQGGCHSMSVVRMFARDADADWVVGWVEGDPFSDVEGDEHTEQSGDIGFKAIGGYIRFTNGIECFSHYNTTRSGIEVVCSRGVFVSDLSSFHLWKAIEGAEGRLIKDLRETEGLFVDVRTYDDIGKFDDDGWAIPENRLNDTVQRVVDSLETGVPPRCSGEDLLKSLEICIALRESHRRGHAPVSLPLEDRSLKMMPVTIRWNNKTDLMDRERYDDILARSRRPAGPMI